MNLRSPLSWMYRSGRSKWERKSLARTCNRPLVASLASVTQAAVRGRSSRAELFVALILCSACAITPHTKVLVEYTRAEPIERVAVEVVNATGQELPMPQAGIIEQAVRLVTRQPEPESTVTDAFVRAATEHLTGMNLRVDTSDTTAGWRLRVTLESWDVRDNGTAGAVVVVSANYQLLDSDGAVSWEAQQDRLPVRLDGPNLSRHEVAHIARTCVDLGLASLPGSRNASAPDAATLAFGARP